MDAWAFGLALLVLFVIGIFILQMVKFHKCKYGDIQNGYQYCKICRRAAKPLTQPFQSCQHKWKVRNEAQITTLNKRTNTNEIIGKTIIQECKLCGDLKHFIEKV